MPPQPSLCLRGGQGRLVVVLAIFAMLAASLRADVLVWDTQAGTDGAQDGLGTWTTGLPNWFNQTLNAQDQSWADGSDAIFGSSAGAAGAVTLSGPISVGNLTFNAATTGAYTLGGSGVLTLTNSTITSNVAATVDAVLAGDTAWSKLGAGQLTLGGAVSNTHTGAITVGAGVLHLAKTAGARALAGNLDISGGASVTFSGGTNQIATTAHVTVSGVDSDFNGTGPNSGGVATVTQTLASLTMNGGTFNAGSGSIWNIGAVGFVAGTNRVFVGNSGAKLTFGSLSLVGMNGAASSTAVANGFTIFGNGGSLPNRTTLTIGAGGLSMDGSIIRMSPGSSGSELVLNGSVTTAGTAASSIEREAGAGLLPYVSLSGTAGVVSRTFDIGGGGANLTIAPIIQNGAATTASIIKMGTGTLTFSGAEANTYSGETTINAGTLRLNKTAGVTSVAGNVIINAGGTLQLSTNNQIADTAGITFNGGTMTGWTTDETIAFLTQNSGGLATSGNTGHVIVTGALTLAGGSTLTINSNPGSANPASWNVGSAILTGADILIGGSNGAGNPRTSLTIGSGGLTMAGRTITMNVGDAGTILNLNGDFTGSGTNNIVTNSTASLQPLLVIGAASRTFNVTSGTTAVGVIISGTGGSLVKAGAGLLQLTAPSTYSGSTTVSGGSLSLAGVAGGLSATSSIVVNGGGAFLSGSPTAANNNGITNRINPAATLTLGGGAFTQLSAAAGTHAQSLESLAITSGVSTVNVTAAASTTSTLTFAGANPYTRMAGAVNFIQNPVVGGSVVFSNAPSGAGNVLGGFLVGATLNGSDLIAAQSGVLTAFSGWVPTGIDTWTENAAMDVTGTNVAAYTSTTVNALRFNTAGAQTVTLDGTHTVASGMILVNPTVGDNDSILIGGQLRGPAGGELVIIQNNTLKSFEIGSAIVDHSSASGVLKSGAGLLVLSGTNSYTGTTRISDGTLRAVEGAGLPTASMLALDGGVFETTTGGFTRSLGTGAGQVSLSGISAGVSAFGSPLTVNIGGAAATLVWGAAGFDPATLVLNSTTANAALDLANALDLNGLTRGIRVGANTATVTSIIDSASGSPAGLVKSGAGVLRLPNGSTYQGGTTITGGVIAVGNDGALGAGTITLAGGGLSTDGGARSLSNNVIISGAAPVSGAHNLTLTGSVTNSSATQTLTTSMTGGAVFEIAGNLFLSESATAARTLQIFGSGDRLISGVIANNAGSNTLGSHLFFNGGGTLSLTGTNTYSGRTLAAGGGYLVLNQDRNLGVVPATPLTDALILAGTGRLRASASFTLDANRGIGIGNSGGGVATAQIDVVSNSVFRVAGIVANRTRNHDGTTSGSNVGGLTKTGTGVLELSGANTYSGLTSVSNGILRVLSNTGLGTTEAGVTVASAAHLELGDGVTVTGETITISTTMGTVGVGSVSSSRGGLQAAAGARAEWAGDVILGVNQARIGVQEGGWLTVSGNITDGASSYSLRLSGETSGTGGLIISGTGNAWDGETELVRGTIYLGAHNALPTSTILDIHFSTNNTEYSGLDMNGFDQTVGSLRNDGNSGVFADLTNSSRTLSTMTVNESGSITYGGLISGNVALVKGGAGTLTLSQSANRFTGGAKVNEGTLRISSATALAEGNVTVNGGGGAGGKLDINNTSAAINALNGAAGTVTGLVANESATNATRTLSIGVNHGSGSYAGNIIDNSGGASQGRISIAKIGAGTQTLSGTGTYSGATLVSNGTLIADYAAGTPLGGSAITLQGGTLVIRNAASTSIGNLSLLQSGSDFTNNRLRIEGTGTVTTPQFSAGSFAPLLLDLSSGSTLVATALGSGTVINSGVLMGTGNRATLWVKDAAGTGFATRDGSNQIVRYTGATILTSGSATTTNTTNYLIDQSLTRTLSLNFNTLQIDSSAGQVDLNMGSSGIAVGTNGRTILITGDNDVNISSTTGAITGGSVFFSNQGAGATTIGMSVAGNATINAGPGLVIFSHSSNPADFYAAGGVSRFTGADRDYSANLVRIYGGGVLELGVDLNGASDGDFTRAVGTATGNVALIGNGGFSAYGEDRVVALGGTAAPAAQTWGANSFLSGPGGDNNYTFMLGSAHSTHTLEFQNAINLGTRERRIEVANGSSSTNVDARLTGVLSGAGGSVIKEGAGRLELTAMNTYTGRTDVNAGSLVVAAGASTGTGAVTVAANAVLMGSGTVAGSSFTLAGNGSLHGGHGTESSHIGTLNFQTTSKAFFAIQADSNVTLDIQTATAIDSTFGGYSIGSADYNAYLDSFSGLGSGTHDLLIFDGGAGSSLVWSGNLLVRPEGFTAAPGQIFNLLDWTTLTSADFSGFNAGANFRTGADDNGLQFDLPALTGGLAWDISRFTTSGVIAIVPEPGRVLLLLLGLLPLTLRRRR